MKNCSGNNAIYKEGRFFYELISTLLIYIAYSICFVNVVSLTVMPSCQKFLSLVNIVINHLFQEG